MKQVDDLIGHSPRRQAMFMKDSMKFWTISWEHNDIRVTDRSRHIEVRVDSWSEVVNIVRSLLGRDPVYDDHRTFEDDKYLKVWHLDVGQNDETGPRVNISEDRILLGWTSPLVVARMAAEDQIAQLTKERDEARKAAEYWHQRFFMTDGYDAYDPNTNGWLPIKWSTNGKSVYTEPPVEDEDCYEGDL